jgi:hypothetical protein
LQNSAPLGASQSALQPPWSEALHITLQSMFTSAWQEPSQEALHDAVQSGGVTLQEALQSASH